MKKKLLSILALTAILAATLLSSGCDRLAASSTSSQSKTSTAKITRGDLQVGLSADGNITLPVTNLDFSVEGTITKIYVSEGDMVKKGDLLAELDDTDLQLALTNAQNALDKANLAYEDAIFSADYNLKNEIKNLESQKLQLNTAFDDYSYNLTIRDAEASLERKLKELEDAQAALDDLLEIYGIITSGEENYLDLLPNTETAINLKRKINDLLDAEDAAEDAENGILSESDEYTYRQKIADAETNLERKLKDLEDAQAALEEAESKVLSELDEYNYQLSITEATTALERKKATLKEAEDNLAQGKRKVYEAFDEAAYQAKIDTAQKTYNRKLEDYYTLQASGTADSSKLAAAQREMDDALAELVKTQDGLQTARDAHNSDIKEKRQSAVDAAQKTVDSAKLAVTDAEASLSNAVTNLQRARESAIENETDAKQNEIDSAETKLKSAQNAYDDAAAALESAEKNLAMAGTNAADSAQTKLTNAKNSYEDAMLSLNTSIQNAKTKVETAQTSYSDAENSLANARENLARAKKSYDADQVSLKTSYDLQVMKVDNLKSSSSTITNALLEIDNAKLKLSEAENNLSKSKLTASIDGKILSITKKEGETVSAQNSGAVMIFGTGGSAFMTICDTTEIFFTTSVTEGDIVGIYEGQTIKATVDALGDVNVPATVYSVSSVPSTDSSGIVTYKVVGKLDEVNPDLKDGMSAFLTFIKKEKADVLLVPVKAVFIENNKQYVNVELSDGSFEKREVVTGLSNGSQAEVVEGLVEGETVAVGSVKK